MAPKLTKKEREQIKIVKYLLDQDDIDMKVLRRLAVAHGFVTTEVRKKAWPKLLGVNVWTATVPYCRALTGLTEGSPWPMCRERDQVEKDVDRSLWFMREEKGLYRQQLGRMINWVLHEEPSACYYQGLHDVASVLLVVCGESIAAVLLLQLVRSYLAEFVLPDIKGVTNALTLVHVLISLEDPPLAAHLLSADLGDAAHFTLSWVLTWFSHPLDMDIPTACRLFDVFLSTHPLMSVYLAAAVVVHRREAALAAEADFAELYSLLHTLPPGLPWDTIIVGALKLCQRLPPRELLRKMRPPPVPACAFLRYPFPFVTRPQHSDRWLWRHSDDEEGPAERVADPAVIVTDPRRYALLQSRPGALVGAEKPEVMQQAAKYAFYALSFALSAVGYMAFTA
eukprot:TRINITY_DN58789_c0_g1_i1.p1 TRINITY_DN58789_c0_g1~~TRINITY_DN58789_c0_g1_i1.p1  ORF type:complete len:396 (+),score=74.02 TRINITY_DN58789_c0_g1_i1:64-1251(+)